MSICICQTAYVKLKNAVMKMGRSSTITGSKTTLGHSKSMVWLMSDFFVNPMCKSKSKQILCVPLTSTIHFILNGLRILGWAVLPRKCNPFFSDCIFQLYKLYGHPIITIILPQCNPAACLKLVI